MAFSLVFIQQIDMKLWWVFYSYYNPKYKEEWNVEIRWMVARLTEKNCVVGQIIILHVFTIAYLFWNTSDIIALKIRIVHI